MDNTVWYSMFRSSPRYSNANVGKQGKMIFFLLYLVFVVPPTSFTYAGGSALFQCRSVSVMTIASVVWLINGSLLQDLTLDNVRDALLFEEGNTVIQGGSLTFTGVPVEYNTTTIQCLVKYSTGNAMGSENTSVLLIQG